MNTDAPPSYNEINDKLPSYNNLPSYENVSQGASSANNPTGLGGGEGVNGAASTSNSNIQYGSPGQQPGAYAANTISSSGALPSQPVIQSPQVIQQQGQQAMAAPAGMQAGQMMQVQMPDGTVQYMMAMPANNSGVAAVQPQMQVQPQVQVIRPQVQQVQQVIQQPQQYNFGVQHQQQYAPNGVQYVAQHQPQSSGIPLSNGTTIQTNTISPATTTHNNANTTIVNQQAIQQANATNERQRRLAEERKQKQTRGWIIVGIGVILCCLTTVWIYFLFIGIIAIIWGSIWACNCCQGGASNPNARVQTVRTIQTVPVQQQVQVQAQPQIIYTTQQPVR